MRLLGFFLVLSCAGIAHADVVSEPPAVCPEGSAPEFCHGPPTCRTRVCTSDADCAPTETCAAKMLCTRRHSCGGRLIEPTYDHAIGDCGTRTCVDEGGTCGSFRVCIPRGSSVDAGPRPRDAGPVPPVDAGRVDAGSSGADAGRVDAGRPSGVDAGPGGSGGSGSDRGGCGCQMPGAGSGAGAALLVAGVLSLLAARRRRPR